jgi:hypothetical protein
MKELSLGYAGLSGPLSYVRDRLWHSKPWVRESNLVDSASSHTLVSKIKPCMSKYNHYTGKLRTAHYISYCFFDSPLLLGYL